MLQAQTSVWIRNRPNRDSGQAIAYMPAGRRHPFPSPGSTLGIGYPPQFFLPFLGESGVLRFGCTHIRCHEYPAKTSEMPYKPFVNQGGYPCLPLNQ